MKTWQKYWLCFVVVFFSIHLIRDIFQDLGIHSFISDILVKSDPSKTPVWYWSIFNTYVFEISAFVLAIFSLKHNKFSPLGYITMVIVGLFAVIWLFYWIFL